MPTASQATPHAPAEPEHEPPVEPPVGGYGPVTVVGTGKARYYLICRTERGRRGWGLHTGAGSLLTSGWTTRARAVAYAEQLLARRQAGGTR
jgi:hypothetical protein